MSLLNPNKCAYANCKVTELSPLPNTIGCIEVDDKIYHQICYQLKTENKYKAEYNTKGEFINALS